MAYDKAVDALKALLLELPAEFDMNPADSTSTRTQFRVIKARNVRKVHEALWELQEYFGLTEE
jgi:hypothetical protein